MKLQLLCSEGRWRARCQCCWCALALPASTPWLVWGNTGAGLLQLPWSLARRSQVLDQVCVHLHAHWRQLLGFMSFRWSSRIPINPCRSSLSLLSPALHPALLPICWSCISAVTSGPPPNAGHSLLGTSSPASFNKSRIPLNSFSLQTLQLCSVFLFYIHICNPGTGLYILQNNI